MNKRHALLLLFLGLWLGGCKPGFEVYDLRCEGLEGPLAIDTDRPHFSWKTRSSAPFGQYAYEIEIPGVWYSGKVLSDAQVMVPYTGEALASRQLYSWRVRVWKNEQEASPWSPLQRFGIGITGDDRLQGRFIGAAPGEGRAPLLRRRFTVDSLREGTAVLHVNSLGYHEAYINGMRVGDAVLSPAVSQLDKRSLIVSYDVTPLLREGQNDILLHIGSGWYKEQTFGTAYDGPLVQADLDLVCDGGIRPLLRTDGSWEGSPSAYRDPGTWRPHGFAGEIIDARIQPVWRPVDVVEVTGLTASPQPCEPCRVQEVLEPVAIEPLGGGSWRVDFGRVVNAQLELALPGLPPGHRVVALYADVLSDRIDTGICGSDEFISSGTREGDRFINRFNHHVFRYVQLDSLPEAPRLVRAHRMRTDFASTASFRCSDDELNRIHDLVAHTMDNLAFNGYMVDCASIERLGYGGDGNASTLSLQLRADVAPLYLNWLQAWADAQRPDGGLPHTAPNPYTAGGGPYWCSFLVQAPWRTYVSYGDSRAIRRFYPNMKRWLAYVDAYSRDGLLQRWPDEDYRGWYLGDWAAPHGVDVRENASVALVSNCTLVQSLQALEQMALLLGETADAETFRLRCTALQERIHEAFYHPETGSYASGSQLDLAYPLLSGVVPQTLRQQVRDTLVARTERLWDGHLATGLVGIPVLSEWATRQGECEWMYGMLKQHGYPGYLDMLDQGATGVWEEWDGGRSHLHNCYNGIGSWFYQALGGIVAQEPGYRRVRIAPQIPAGLAWVDVTVPTPYGPLHVRRDGMQLRLEVPVGVTAEVAGNSYGNGRHRLRLSE